MVEIAYTALIQKYGVEKDLAFRLVQELTEGTPLPGMSIETSRRWKLQEWLNMSPQEAQDFLGRYYDA